MNDIALHIEYLLTRHDCVVVPGWGAFLVHDSHAEINADTECFEPPARQIGFNPELTINDGLLAASVARREKMSINAAVIEVERRVEAFRGQLAETGQLQFGRLGVFSVTGDGATLFSPAADSAPIVRYSGLQPLRLNSLAADNDAETETAAAQGGMLRLPALVRIVASVIMLLMVGGTLYLTSGIADSHKATYASLDSGISNYRHNTVAAPLVDPAVEVSRPIQLLISAPDPAEGQAVYTENKVAASTSATPKRYMLVVASLDSEKSALRHINGREGLAFVNMDGNYRVYVESYDTKGEAYGAVERVRTEYPNVWVCRR